MKCGSIVREDPLWVNHILPLAFANYLTDSFAAFSTSKLHGFHFPVSNEAISNKIFGEYQPSFIDLINSELPEMILCQFPKITTKSITESTKQMGKWTNMENISSSRWKSHLAEVSQNCKSERHLSNLLRRKPFCFKPKSYTPNYS